ncbi:MAG: SDR family oxidoreductase [Acidobacteria bacterium]|nr:SDR family oxidoreductase [Acidobacteriota bacterium]
MSSTFTDQRIIITGASSGIGAEVARQLAAQGARLSLAARREPELEAVAARCRELGGEALVIPTDVTDRDQCRRLVEGTVATFGGLDMLINNAGFSSKVRSPRYTSADEWRAVMAVNTLGPMVLTRELLPAMSAQGSGDVVLVSSLAAHRPNIMAGVAYSAAKAAVTQESIPPLTNTTASSFFAVISPRSPCFCGGVFSCYTPCVVGSRR